MTHHPGQYVLRRHPPRLQMQFTGESDLHLVDGGDVDPRHGGDLLEGACVASLATGQRNDRGGQPVGLFLPDGGHRSVFEDGPVAQAVCAVLPT